MSENREAYIKKLMDRYRFLQKRLLTLHASNSVVPKSRLIVLSLQFFILILSKQLAKSQARRSICINCFSFVRHTPIILDRVIFYDVSIDAILAKQHTPVIVTRRSQNYCRQSTCYSQLRKK